MASEDLPEAAWAGTELKRTTADAQPRVHRDLWNVMTSSTAIQGPHLVELACSDPLNAPGTEGESRHRDRQRHRQLPLGRERSEVTFGNACHLTGSESANRATFVR